MEDSRFIKVKKQKKKHIHHHLHWFLGEDYFTDELVGVYDSELYRLKSLTSFAFDVLEKATDAVIAQNDLAQFGFPVFFQKCIEHSWKNRDSHPFLYGRFDINGGLDGLESKIIEFNADTCSTVPETIIWQKSQLDASGSSFGQFNDLEQDLIQTFTKIKNNLGFDDCSILATSFGHPEDVANCSTVLSCASKAGFNTFYSNLEKVIFSDDGVFYPIGQEFERVDALFKIVPWDWMFNDEPELAQILSNLTMNDKLVVLNPPYASLWQNKKFLAYITQNFRTNPFAETYLDKNNLAEFVQKPIYGRIGENIKLFSSRFIEETQGDFENQEKVYQKYYPLVQDDEEYFYQVGMFYTYKPSALNLRAQDSHIINDDCEFISHYLMF